MGTTGAPTTLHSASMVHVVFLKVVFWAFMSTVSLAQSWDLTAGFSQETNPRGVWTYGWTDRLGGELHTYDLFWGAQEESTFKGFWAPGSFGPVRAWTQRRLDESTMLQLLPRRGELPYPDHFVEADFKGAELVAQAAGMPSYPDAFGFVSRNLSEKPSSMIGYRWEPGAVLLMPPGGQGKDARTVARWSAPETCRVIVKARFTGQRMKADSGRRADINVLHNGTRVYDGLIDGFIDEDVPGKFPQREWSAILPVVKGDSVDFVVGTGSDFNYNVFSNVGNKQALPAVGLAANISVLVDEDARARRWVAAKLKGHSVPGLPPGQAVYHTDTPGAPFSFVYGGKPSREILKTWKSEHASEELDPQRTAHTLTYSDPSTGLVIRCRGVEYHDSPTVEWTVYLKNSGATDTPMIENLQALDMRIERGPVGEFVLHEGGVGRVVETRLVPNSTTGGEGPFNVELPGEGVIVVFAWRGPLGVEIARDAQSALVVRGGQKLTHFRLQPGEEVRTPLVVLQFWTGDRVEAQNVWRRWMVAHNMPRPGGQPLEPQLSATSSYWYGNMIFANEENQKLFIARYVEEALKPDYWWMDAGWYPPNITKIGKVPTPGWGITGTWEVDKRRFPDGLRAVTDYAHARDIKSILWFNEERVSTVFPTWLNENHPEWLLGENGRDKLFDFGNAEAWEWAVEHFSGLLEEQGIDIHRMDTMISGGPFWRAKDAEDRQGISEIRHVVGYLAFLDELLKRNPRLRLDHHRTDLETLRRTAPLILGIDYEPIGDQCHNYRLASWIPWHGLATRGPINSYGFRSTMCPAISMGWDLRLRDLDYDLARRLIGEWRMIAPNYLGDFYPLTPYSEATDVWMAWQYDRPEAGEGVVQAFRRRESSCESMLFALRGLEADARYELKNLDETEARRMTGKELMRRGLEVRIDDCPGAVVVIYKRK